MVRKRRSRMVYFRLHEDDYNRLMAMCDTQNANSLSDLLRSAVYQVLGQPVDHEEMREIAALHQRIERLSAELQRLSDVIDQNHSAAERKPAAGESVPADA